ncbi:GtrA family protein [Thiomonas sp.]
MKMKEILFFGMAGSAGFVTDVAIVWFLTLRQINPLAAQAAAFSVAVIITWYINRRFTFNQHASKNRLHEFGKYLAANIFGAIITNGIYAFLVIKIALFSRNPVLAVFVGATAGLLFNFISLKWFVFRT